MSLSYIPYISVDLVENLDLQTLNNAFEKLYVNDLFYHEIDKIAPKVFINGATYSPGDCVWMNTEDPSEFVLSSNIHWRLIQAQVKKQNKQTAYPFVSQYDLLIVKNNRTYPNTIEHGGQLDPNVWSMVSAQYEEAISCAYDIGTLSDSVQIYQYTGPEAVLTIPTKTKFSYADNVKVLNDESAPSATYTLSTWTECISTSIEWSTRGVSSEVSSTYLSCTQVSSYNLKVPYMSMVRFFDVNWKQLLDSPVKKEKIESYVLSRLEEHFSTKESPIYRDHPTASISSLSAFDVKYLDTTFANIDDSICQLNIPNLANDDVDDTNTGFDYVYKTVIFKDRWFRLWKSGLLEHGGKVTLTEADLTSTSGIKVNLNWPYLVPESDEQLTATTYTYSLATHGQATTNTGTNGVSGYTDESTYLLADNNRYQISYTWCNDQDNAFYRPLIDSTYSTQADKTTINFTECNVYNVKNSSFVIPNRPYLLSSSVEEGYITHLHPTLYYYTTGFTRNIKLNKYSQKVHHTKVDLSDCILDASFDYNQEYTGKPITPEFKLTYDGLIKVDGLSGTDYTVEYYNNISVGTATINISACDSSTLLKGQKIVNFNINPLPALKVDVQVIGGPYKYKRSAWQPSIACSSPVSGTIYPDNIVYSNNINVGTATATVTFNNKNVQGTKSTTFEIIQRNLEDCYLSTDPLLDDISAGIVYVGEAVWPKIRLYAVQGDEDTLLVNGDDYVVEHDQSINVGNNYKLAIKGNNMCTGTLAGTYRIVPKDLSSASISAYWTLDNVDSANTFETKDGEPLSSMAATQYLKQRYSLTVTDNTKKLTKGIDYVVEADFEESELTAFSKLAGNIKGIGNYSGMLNTKYDPFDHVPLQGTQGTIET